MVSGTPSCRPLGQEEGAGGGSGVRTGFHSFHSFHDCFLGVRIGILVWFCGGCVFPLSRSVFCHVDGGLVDFLCIGGGQRICQPESDVYCLKHAVVALVSTSGTQPDGRATPPPARKCQAIRVRFCSFLALYQLIWRGIRFLLVARFPLSTSGSPDGW